MIQILGWNVVKTHVWLDGFVHVCCSSKKGPSPRLWGRTGTFEAGGNWWCQYCLACLSLFEWIGLREHLQISTGNHGFSLWTEWGFPVNHPCNQSRGFSSACVFGAPQGMIWCCWKQGTNPWRQAKGVCWKITPSVYMLIIIFDINWYPIISVNTNEYI